MYTTDIVVDEKIEEKIRRLEAESYNRINNGVGMWGRRALDYIFSDVPSFTLQIELEDGGDEAINAYGKMIDEKAHALSEAMEEKLLALPEYELTGEFLKDVQKRKAITHIIEEEIYAELIYVKELVRF